MPTQEKKKRLTIYSVIVLLILVFGIIFPLYHLYVPLFEHKPAISVEDGYYSVTYSGNYKNITENSTPFSFSTNTSMASVHTAGHANSTLSINLAKGNIIYNKVENQVIITYNLSVRGHFTSYLRPNTLILSIGVIGKNTTISTWAPPFSTLVPVAENITPDNLGNLAISGTGNVSVLTNLLNYTNQVPFYNFFVSVTIEINVAWNPVTTHTFVMGTQVKGLSKLVKSTLSMTIVETN